MALSATTIGLSIRVAWRPSRSRGLFFLNSAARMLALDSFGEVVRDTGVIVGWNPGGGTFGPDGRYFVGLRNDRTVLALSASLKCSGEYVLPPAIVPFPRGFGFNAEGNLFLSSGVGPDGNRDDRIVAFAGNRPRPVRLVEDPNLSPLDLTVAPNGNVVVSSERPFGAIDAVTTVGEYDPESGRLVLLFSASGVAEFQRPRGLRFGAVVRLARLHGQAMAFFPL